MKRLSDFESLGDFGYKATTSSNGKVQFVKCDCDFDDIEISYDGKNVYVNGDLTTGKFFSLEDIVSGGSLVVNLSDVVTDQAELSLDYTLPTSLAFLGSVYSTVSISISHIKETYPNGFRIDLSLTGPAAVMFNNEDIYTYGAGPFSLSDYTDYELVQEYNGAFDSTFQISGSVVGLTYSVLMLDGSPTGGTGWKHYVQPKSSTLDKFYGSLSQYELDLLVPPHNRGNFWPRETSAPNILMFEGTEYDTFLSTELSWGEVADHEEANFIWRKFYPDGQKILDSDDGLMQRMILVMAMNFDKIKLYQDQLKYQHTVGYENFNHISKDLVDSLSNQWNWKLGHTLNQTDYSEYIYSQYENYVTGQSQQKISSRDVNFEMSRRVLSNLVTLYKKKGTREAVQYIANMYGLPEALFWIEELVNAIVLGGRGNTELMESESNIIVPIGGQQYYIDENGSAMTLPYRVVSNTKYLNVNISPLDAIEFDFYDWGIGGHPDIVGVGGYSVKLSGTSDTTSTEFFRRILKNTIKSDGSARYDSGYPLLENEGVYYNTLSVNKMGLMTLRPYMNFLDANWNILLSNLIPASSRLLSIGNLYRNPLWRREKYQWNDSELDARTLPFNEVVDLPDFIPTITLKKTNSALIEIDEPVISSEQKKYGQIDPIAITSSKQVGSNIVVDSVGTTGKSYAKIYGLMDFPDPPTSYISPFVDGDSIEYSTTAKTYSIHSPILEPIAGQSGSSTFVDYSSDSLVVTNENNFNVSFSAYNLSDSGYTSLHFELFRKNGDDPVVIDTEEYSIMNVVLEDGTHGIYKVSSILNIDKYDFITINSEYLPHINSVVQVVHIDSGTSTIRTFPKIGLFTLPVGTNNSVVDWMEFVDSGAMDKMYTLQVFGVSLVDQIRTLNLIARYIESGSDGDLSLLENELTSLGIANGVRNIFYWFMTQDVAIVYGSMLVLDFVDGSTTYRLGHGNIYNLINAVVQQQTKAKFNRVINFFNWMDPDQQLVYSNVNTESTGNFSFSILSASTRAEGNNYSMSGTVSFGGLDELNSDILRDKEEYFYRYKARTHAPLSWGTVDGLQTVSGIDGPLIESEYDLNYVNNIKYYGRYFMYMKRPKVPVSRVDGLSSSQVTRDASVTVKFNGVSDSSRLEIQYYPLTGEPAYSTSYTSLTESNWISTATTINIKARSGVGDDYIYTVQTTLEPDTYYWLRVKNYRNKINMFGHNLEQYSTTEPTWFKTGGFSDSGTREGEIPIEAEAPTNISNPPTRRSDSDGQPQG